MKRCNACNTALPLEFFNRDKSTRDGMQRTCRICQVRYRQDHVVETAARDRAYKKSGRGKQSASKAQKKRYMKNPDQFAAHMMVRGAVMLGLLGCSPVCQICSAAGKTEAHHEDYRKPLEVIWLCKPCHTKKHRKG